MTRSQAASQHARFRQRKLNTKAPLEILREDQVEVDNEPQNIPKLSTGVEEAEEVEHHLQAAIASQAAVGKVAQQYIPTPETVLSSLKYEELYPPRFSQPATYIRFSSTVEDCTGCPYNMSEEDDVFLKQFNESAARDASTQCSEDQFEVVMHVFEETAKAQQPFSNVSGDAPVLAFADLVNSFDENVDETSRMLAKDVYPHWKARRQQNLNQPLQPTLKVKLIEMTNDADENDPYVCFRRREVRTVRKTRGRDAQSVDKLKKLRKELEEARHITALVRTREMTKLQQLEVDMELWQKRQEMIKLKRNLPEPYRDGDEELLITQKPKRIPLGVTPGQSLRLNSSVRLASNGRPERTESELVTLKDVLIDKENKIQAEIKLKITQHAKWNEGFVDNTNLPLRSPLSDTNNSSFRTAITEYLPTPPESVASEHSGDDVMAAMEAKRKEKEAAGTVAVRYASPNSDRVVMQAPSFRRRVGRGGRIMIDRRRISEFAHGSASERMMDRFKYDHDEDEDEDVSEIFTVDPFSIPNMLYRARLTGTAAHQSQQSQQSQAAIMARKAQAEAAQHSGNAPTPVASSGGPRPSTGGS